MGESGKKWEDFLLFGGVTRATSQSIIFPGT